MTGWLVVNGFLKSGKFDELARMFCEAAKCRSVSLQIKRNTECPVTVGGPFRQSDWKEVMGNAPKPDFVIFWDKDILLAQFLESMDIPVYNSSRSIEICDDKRKTHLSLYRAGIPMPATIVSPMTFRTVGFGSLDFLEGVQERLSYPMVVKEAFGSFGEQVFLAGNRKQLEQIIRQASSTELIFQQYIAASRGRDLRIQIVGGRVVGAMYRYSETDFRANITAGGHMRSCQPSQQEQELAVRAAQAVDCDFAGVDLLFGDDGPLVCEVNSNAHFKNLLDCSGVNTAEEIVDYVIRRTVHGTGATTGSNRRP